MSWLRTKRNPALLPGQWITLRKSALQRGKQATFRPERKPPTTLDSACRPHPGPTSSPLPRPASSTQRRRRAAPPGVHRPPHAWSSCARRLQPVIGHVRPGSPARPGAPPRSRWQRWGSRSLASAPSREVRTAAAAGASGPAPPQSGQRDRGLRAPPPPRPWLRVPLGSAPLGSGTCASGAAAPSSSASPGGQLLPAARRAFEPPFPAYGFPRQENFASVPTSISRPLPPLPVGARAHSHTHTHTRRRACARPRARSRGISGAATHTGFQPPLGVLCLRQRRSRRRRGRRLQPGPVSELGAQDRVQGEAEKEGAEARRSRAAPAPGAAAPAVAAASDVVPNTKEMPSDSLLNEWLDGWIPLNAVQLDEPERRLDSDAIKEVIHSQYDAIFIIPGGERAHHVQKHLACRSSTVFHGTAFVNSFHLKEFGE
ncbi:translation initiation factor IF-2-like [Bubalus kerabau]|uniref:translation initiation factor IF-2-like n=1 Tax=Bubalus carabanensis TaxID=3119969 RepID=UPI00244F022F|nr:translation initiation factor IF-2-like [Bubalus carabanensis]